LTLVKSGKIKALAVTSRKRSPALPELPSMAEAGVPNYDESTWNGLLAPARTPPAIIRKLNNELGELLKMPAVRERFTAEGAEPVATSPEAFAAIISSEVKKWAAVIREAGIRTE
jgi:tripartite-type tricarboxylate transporter receptor subunit TctC